MILKDVVKTENIIKASPNDTLSTALGHLTSSHDAAFVFTKDDRYMGVINPYYAMIKTSNPGTTKVMHCLYHPPKIHLGDKIERVGQLMSESKVHYLPIFDEKEEFLGITTARRLLRYLLTTPHKDRKLGEVLSEKNGKLVTAYENDTLHTAIDLYKQYKISKLVIIDKNMKLKGILSYYDLIPYIAAPGGKQQRATNIDEREKFLQMKVKNYAKKTMLTCSPTHKVGEAIQSILTHNMGSVIITDGESHPIGIITTRDILDLLRSRKTKKQIELTTKNVSSENDASVQDLSNHVQKFIEKDPAILRARIMIHEGKKGELFTISVNVIPVKGEPMVFEHEGVDLGVMVRDAKKILAKFREDEKKGKKK
jgi:CBS domain-containing protein